MVVVVLLLLLLHIASYGYCSLLLMLHVVATA